MSHDPPNPAHPEGLEELVGDDALREAESVERAARAGGADPLAGLAARVRAEGPAPAFEPAALAALAALRREQPARFVALVDAAADAARAGGRRFPRTELRKALDAADGARRERERRDARRGAAGADPDAEGRRAAADEALARARASAPEALAAHFGAHAPEDDTGDRFVKSPGRIAVERPGRGGRPEARLLAEFSAVIRRDVLDVDLPGADARRTFELGVVLPGENFERTGEVRADEFAAMRWPEVVFGSRARVRDSGRRDDLRVAVQCLSAPEEVRRYRYTGWLEHEGAMVYLHAGGAIGEGGAVPGLLVRPSGRARHFDFGDLSLDPARGVEAVLEYLAVEPATVVWTLAAAAFRAAMGPTRLSVMVWGPSGAGKSCLAGIAQSMFGASMHGDAMPASWADRSSENGIDALLARVGAAVVGADDFVFRGGPEDVALAKRFDGVIRAHYNRAAPLKLNRDGSQRPEHASRCLPISTGEAKPRGHSTVNRMICVEMPRRSPNQLDRLKQHGLDGVLARAMASFVQWYAPRVRGNLPRLDALERAAALRWGLGGSDRAGALFGALALGAEALFAWLEESGVPRPEVLRHERRARAALVAVAREHGEGVDAENPAHRFLPLLREAIRAGEAHVKVALRGRGGAPPPAAELWGWRLDGHDGPRHQGKCVAWVKNGEVLVDRGVALGVVRERALRAGHPFPLDEKALARDLGTEKLLARTSMHVADRPTHTVRASVGGAQLDLLAFTPAVFGIDLDADGADDAKGDAPPPPDDDFPA